jgi:NAD(P)-dependent dehydrogenase (short-subunit alcohol dehydrogenase family)
LRDQPGGRAVIDLLDRDGVVAGELLQVAPEVLGFVAQHRRVAVSEAASGRRKTVEVLRFEDPTAGKAGMLADPKFYEKLVARIPLGRIAEPEDVAKAVLFFASCAANFVTGQTLYLDGGITATR